MTRPAILCVDDEPAILSALRRSLREGRYEVLTAGSAEQARDVLRHRPVRLVISDQLMPGTTGVELLREVRRRSPETAVLLLTGYPEGMPGDAGIAAGVRWVVTKPWDDRELRDLIDRLVGDEPPPPHDAFDLGGGD